MRRARINTSPRLYVMSRDIEDEHVPHHGPRGVRETAMVDRKRTKRTRRTRRISRTVSRSGVKLANLRRHPYATLVARSGWEWAAVAGPVDLSGPDDEFDDIIPSRQRQLLRDIYQAAGGHHPDLDEYDTAMLAQHRCAVLVHPARIWSNPAGSEHVDPKAIT